MTFYEYMQTQLKQQGTMGDLICSLSIDVKLFPSLGLASYDVSQWRRWIALKYDNGVMAAFDEAAKEWEAQSERG